MSDRLNKKTICIMTSVHRSDDVRIYHKEARALKEHGYDVTMLVSNVKDQVLTKSEWTDEHGIKFIKLELPQSRRERVMKAAKLFYKKAIELNCDYYHFHDPELIKAGLRLTKLNNAKVIYDSHEDVPRQILTKPYLNPFIAKLSSWFFERYENRSVKKLHAVVAAEPVIYDRFIKLNPNTAMVCNYPRLEEFSDIDKDADFDSRESAVCYIGGITKIRGVFEMISAVEGTSCKLVLAGEYETNELKASAEGEKGYSNVDYRGYLDRAGVRAVLSSVVAGLVTLHPVPKYVTALPVKMFEYMIAGVPVIASNFPYWKEIIDDAGCGVCVDPKNPAEIRAAIEYLCENKAFAKQLGMNGRKKVIEKYNWDIEKIKLFSLYDNLKY